jgi:hypothetical protein
MCVKKLLEPVLTFKTSYGHYVKFNIFYKQITLHYEHLISNQITLNSIHFPHQQQIRITLTSNIKVTLNLQQSTLP